MHQLVQQQQDEYEGAEWSVIKTDMKGPHFHRDSLYYMSTTPNQSSFSFVNVVRTNNIIQQVNNTFHLSFVIILYQTIRDIPKYSNLYV